MQPLEELATITDCVGGAGLAALCLLLAQDHSGWGGEHSLSLFVSESTAGVLLHSTPSVSA